LEGTLNKRTIHGIDLTAPGGLEALFAYRRAQFGDAMMMAGEPADAGDAAGAPADGAGATDQGTAGTDTGAADPKSADADKGGDIWADPVKAKAEIERLRAENGKDRTTAKTKAAEEARNELTQTLGKALGLIKDGEDKPDPAKLTQQITETAAKAKQAETELAVYKTAAKQGADADALLDSRAFLAKIADLDPSNTKAITTAIEEAVKENPKLATVQAAGASGADFSGGSGESAKKATSLEDAIAKKMASR
jgi:hypothetical protein